MLPVSKTSSYLSNQSGYSYASDNIDNTICENDGSVKSEHNIKKTPALAFYEDGKAVCALKAKWRECHIPEKKKEKKETENYYVYDENYVKTWSD